jgi:hypothetical protein
MLAHLLIIIPAVFIFISGLFMTQTKNHELFIWSVIMICFQLVSIFVYGFNKTAKGKIMNYVHHLLILFMLMWGMRFTVESELSFWFIFTFSYSLLIFSITIIARFCLILKIIDL